MWLSLEQTNTNTKTNTKTKKDKYNEIATVMSRGEGSARKGRRAGCSKVSRQAGRPHRGSRNY